MSPSASPRNAAADGARARATAPQPRRAAAKPQPQARSKALWLVPLVSAALVVAFVVTYYPVARVQYKELRYKAQLEARLTALEERNDRLRRQVASLETTAGIEDYARSELGMVKAGEHAVILSDSSGSVPTSTISPTAQSIVDCEPVAAEPTGAWTEFLDFVFQVK